MHTQRSRLVLVAAFALLAACTKPAEDAKKPAADGKAADATQAAPAVVATVNDEKISAETFNVFVEAVTGKPAKEAPKEQQEQMLDQLISMVLAAQAAEKDGTANDPAVKARMQLVKSQVLAEAVTDKYLKSHPVSESEVKAEYDKQVANLPKEYKARHILVETKEKADAILKELAGGADFAALAKKESKDPGSGKNGGDLGWFNASSMVKPFADAVAKLEKGQTTQAPVQSEFGWHIIQLEDTRSTQAPAFDDVKQQVEMLTQRSKLQAYLEELRKNAKIQKSL